LFPSVETTLSHSQKFQSSCSRGNVHMGNEYLPEITLLHDIKKAKNACTRFVH
jgi:hypothetical protein